MKKSPLMATPSRQASAPTPWWQTCRLQLLRIVDRLSVVIWNRHMTSPLQIGSNQHDCALSSLYWAVPSIPESSIVHAFTIATDTWPYGGVTNKEFAVALKCLEIESDYSTEINTLGALLATNPARCVALLHGHFVPIVDGVIIGHDAGRFWLPNTHVYCHWMFKRRLFKPVRSSHRTSFDSI